MPLIRPVAPEDLDDLLALSESAGIGLTTLPQDQNALAEKIAASIHAFAAELDAPVCESYLLVLEDAGSGSIVGTTGVLSRLEPGVPFYSYKLSTLMQGSTELGIRKRFEVLHLVNDYQDVSEICTLFLHPDHRQGGNGKLLSRCRFLLMAEHPGALLPARDRRNARQAGRNRPLALLEKRGRPFLRDGVLQGRLPHRRGRQAVHRGLDAQVPALRAPAASGSPSRDRRGA